MPSMLIVANRGAGRGDVPELTDDVGELARDRSIITDVIVPDHPDGVTDAVRVAVDRGIDYVVAVGGDGLVHHVAQCIVGSDTLLGIVASGTGNDIARGFGVDASISGLVQALDRGVTARLDVLRVADRYALSSVIVGFSASVNARADRMTWPRSTRRYVLATLAELPRLAPLSLKLDIDGVRHALDASLLVVANTAYFGGGMAIAPAASPDDGVADLVIVGPVGRVELLRFFPKVYDGSHLRHRAVSVLHGRRILLATEAPAPLRADGEPFGSTPTSISVLPSALRVLGAGTVS